MLEPDVAAQVAVDDVSCFATIDEVPVTVDIDVGVAVFDCVASFARILLDLMADGPPAEILVLCNPLVELDAIVLDKLGLMLKAGGKSKVATAVETSVGRIKGLSVTLMCAEVGFHWALPSGTLPEKAGPCSVTVDVTVDASLHGQGVAATATEYWGVPPKGGLKTLLADCVFSGGGSVDAWPFATTTAAL